MLGAELRLVLFVEMQEGGVVVVLRPVLVDQDSLGFQPRDEFLHRVWMHFPIPLGIGPQKVGLSGVTVGVVANLVGHLFDEFLNDGVSVAVGESTPILGQTNLPTVLTEDTRADGVEGSDP